MTRKSDIEPEIRSGDSEKDNGLIRCDACPVLCRIREGRSGACDRYANEGGSLIRVDPLVVAQRTINSRGQMVPFAEDGNLWDGEILRADNQFVTGLGSSTTYPDYKPAPFIVSSKISGIDMITVVSEGVFSYCGVKVKIDTDRFLGEEQKAVRCDGEQVGHVSTAEYGSQMLALGGVRHLTGGSKREGNVTCQMMMDLCNGEAVEISVDDGVTMVVEAGAAPIIDGAKEERMRVGCGSAAIGMFAPQWKDYADEVIVVDDHITGVLTEHQGGRFLGMPPSGVRVSGRRSTLGRYFQVAGHGQGWGGTDISNPLSILERVDQKIAWPGLRLLFVSTTGEDSEFFILDEELKPQASDMPKELALVAGRIAENCEPALCSVLFMCGAGGSLRAGVTENPVRLTRSVRGLDTIVTCGGAPVYVWPGGGITFMVDITRMPQKSFGYVPTPALVAPIEFTLRKDDYAAMGGYMSAIRPIEEILNTNSIESRDWNPVNPWPLQLGMDVSS